MERTTAIETRESDGRESDRRHEVMKRVLDRIRPSLPADDPCRSEVTHRSDHSNPLSEVRIEGRRLMVKRGLEPWSASRFRASVRASRRITRGSDLLAPDYLDVPERIEGVPVLVWWRLEQPTLGDVWDSLDALQKRSALESCGRMLRRLHRVGAERWGPLSGDGSGDGRPAPSDSVEGPSHFRRFLKDELAGRLRPAAQGVWRDGVKLVDALLERLATVVERARSPRLVHNDPHICNILCEVEGSDVRCVGVLDLEAAAGGPPESDLSYLRLVHSSEMAGRLGDRWMDRVLEGYAQRPDLEMMQFFRVYHVLNIGIYAALKGSSEEAAHLAGIGRASLESG